MLLQWKTNIHDLSDPVTCLCLTSGDLD